MSKRTKTARVGKLVAAGAAIGTLILAAGSALAATDDAAKPSHPHFQKPAAFGTVSSVDGSTVTISSRDGTTYSVDVSGAKITRGFWKDAEPISVSDIKDGDHVMAFGSVDGSDVTATALVDAPQLGRGPAGRARAKAAAGEKGKALGHWMGRHLVGTVDSVSGDTLTVDGRDGKTYTVDASGAEVTEGFASSSQSISLGDIGDGETVIVAGEPSSDDATLVTAKKVRVLVKRS